MAGETDEEVSVTLPPDLAEWVDEKVAERDLDAETVLVQLLAAYRATENIENGGNGERPVAAVSLEGTDIQDEVCEVVADRIPDIAGATVEHLELDARIEAEVERELEDRAPEISERAADRVGDRVESLRSDFREKLEDVRERVVQVKRETDAKAPADHDHPDLGARIDAVAADLGDLESTVADLEAPGSRVDDHEDRLREIDDALEDVREKLDTLAYAVTDLREGDATVAGRDTSVDRLKRAAAEHDVERARCEVCGEGVAVGLLTDPECPHCRATVTDVEPAEGLFGKPKLVKARGIESGDGPGEGDEA